MPPTLADNLMFDRIRRDIFSHDIVLYMKGTVAFPMDGFSAAIVQILLQLGLSFKDINVLEDGELRQGVKAYTQWPGVPQLYIKGEFIGNCDVVREMYASGELQDYLHLCGIAFHDAA